MTPANLETIRTTTLRAARRIRATTGADVPPVLLLFAARPDGTLSDPQPVTIGFLDKDEQAALQQRCAALSYIAAAVLVTECWTVTLAPDDPLPESVGKRPDREEVLMVNLMTATRQYLLTAKIHGESIEEAQFTELNTGDGNTYTGRYVRDGAPAPKLQ